MTYLYLCGSRFYFSYFLFCSFGSFFFFFFSLTMAKGLKIAYFFKNQLFVSLIFSVDLYFVHLFSDFYYFSLMMTLHFDYSSFSNNFRWLVTMFI